MIWLDPWIQTVYCSSLRDTPTIAFLGRLSYIISLSCLLVFFQLLWARIYVVPFVWSDIYRIPHLQRAILLPHLIACIKSTGIIWRWMHSGFVLVWRALYGLLTVICLIRFFQKIGVHRSAFFKTRRSRFVDLVPDCTADARVMSVDRLLGRDHTGVPDDALFQIWRCSVVVTFIWLLSVDRSVIVFERARIYWWGNVFVALRLLALF